MDRGIIMYFAGLLVMLVIHMAAGSILYTGLLGFTLGVSAGLLNSYLKSLE